MKKLKLKMVGQFLAIMFGVATDGKFVTKNEELKQKIRN